MQFSGKRIQIDRAKAVIVGSVGAAVFIFIFSIFACKALLSQRSYQARVTKEQEKAVAQLRANVNSVDKLVTSYKNFAEQPNNILGGNPAGPGEHDGDNARIILDALPSKYDFPALATSLEKILIDRHYKIGSIVGNDDEIAQGSNPATATPIPVEMPFKFSVETSYDSIKGLMGILQSSIRPFVVQSMSFSGKDSTMQFSVSAVTYYLPEKQLNFPTKVVK